MTSFTAFIEAHPTTDLLILGYIGTAVVSSLPDPHDPRPFKDKAYDFLYTFAHILGNSIPTKFRPPAPPAA